MAVAKGHGAERILPVLEAGHRVFGENRVQEAKAKWPPLRERFPDVELHLIGPLQTNKVRDALELFDVIETLDRPRLADALKAEIDKRGPGRDKQAVRRSEHRRGAAEGGRRAEGCRGLRRALP